MVEQPPLPSLAPQSVSDADAMRIDCSVRMRLLLSRIASPSTRYRSRDTVARMDEGSNPSPDVFPCSIDHSNMTIKHI